MLPTPAFHHLHLNSVDPDAAIDFYTTPVPEHVEDDVGRGARARSPNNVLMLFTKVDAPRATQPQTAIWHFGWHVTDARTSLEPFRSGREVKLLPLYTSTKAGPSLISSDTWPGTGGVLGLTRRRLPRRRRKVSSRNAAPDSHTWKVPTARWSNTPATTRPSASITCICGRMIPFCAQLWYQKHLNAPVMQGARARRRSPRRTAKWSAAPTARGRP